MVIVCSGRELCGAERVERDDTPFALEVRLISFVPFYVLSSRIQLMR